MGYLEVIQFNLSVDKVDPSCISHQLILGIGSQ